MQISTVFSACSNVDWINYKYEVGTKLNKKDELNHLNSRCEAAMHLWETTSKKTEDTVFLSFSSHTSFFRNLQ